MRGIVAVLHTKKHQKATLPIFTDFNFYNPEKTTKVVTNHLALDLKLGLIKKH